MLQRGLQLVHARTFFITKRIVYGSVGIQGVRLYPGGATVWALYFVFFGIFQLQTGFVLAEHGFADAAHELGFHAALLPVGFTVAFYVARAPERPPGPLE